MEPETDAERGRVDVPPGGDGPHRRPWGRITAVLVVALVTITALAIAVRQPNRPPSILDVSVSSDTATVATPPTAPTALTFTAHATDPDGDSLAYSWDFGDGHKGSDTETSHVYAVPGWYIAVLTVSDGKGGVVTNDDRLLFIHVRSEPSDGAVPPSPPSPSSCPVTCVTATGLAVLAANRHTYGRGTTHRTRPSAERTSW